MRIAVIAASGRSGREFVNIALSKGHHIKAGVFGRHDFEENESLEVVECDATNINQVKSLIEGCEAVISFIGHGRKSPATVQTDAIKNLVNVADKTGLKRIVSLTGTGVRFHGDKITLIDRILNLSIGLIDPRRVKDGKLHVDVLKSSDTDWTVVRVLKLTNQYPKPYKLTTSGPTKVLTSRKEVALACLEVLEENSFIKQAPIISKS